jgi:hypothetical protein
LAQEALSEQQQALEELTEAILFYPQSPLLAAAGVQEILVQRQRLEVQADRVADHTVQQEMVVLLVQGRLTKDLLVV